MDKVREKLARDEIVMAAGVGRVMHHNLLQIIGIQGGFDCLWFDHEHVGMSMNDLEVGTLAVRSQGMECFVRIAPTDYAIVTRSMEAGGGGVMAAQIHTAEQAEEFVQWAKFAPRGHRGLNTGGWDGQFASIGPKEFCPQANEKSFVAIQIETLTSLEQCDEIAAIDGVDLLFVGPSDLSQSLGVTGDFFNPKCIEALDRVGAACKNHGKHWGAVCVSPEHAAAMVERGCRMLSPTADVKMISAGIDAVKNKYSTYFG